MLALAIVWKCYTSDVNDVDNCIIVHDVVYCTLVCKRLDLVPIC